MDIGHPNGWSCNNHGRGEVKQYWQVKGRSKSSCHFSWEAQFNIWLLLIDRSVFWRELSCSCCVPLYTLLLQTPNYFCHSMNWKHAITLREVDHVCSIDAFLRISQNRLLQRYVDDATFADSFIVIQISTIHISCILLYLNITAGKRYTGSSPDDEKAAHLWIWSRNCQAGAHSEDFS